MAKKYHFSEEEFIIGMEMLYENVVFTAFDRQENRTGPGFIGHTPIYPTERSFLEMFGELSTDFKQPDLTKPENAIEDFGVPDISKAPPIKDGEDKPDLRNLPNLVVDYTPQNPQELFHLIDDDGLKHNHALIMGVMLGLNERDCKKFVHMSFVDYKEKHPEMKNYADWGLWQTLTYAEVKKRWEEKIAALTPNFREVLGAKSEDVPEPELPAVVAAAALLDPVEPEAEAAVPVKPSVVATAVEEPVIAPVDSPLPALELQENLPAESVVTAPKPQPDEPPAADTKPVSLATIGTIMGVVPTIVTDRKKAASKKPPRPKVQTPAEPAPVRVSKAAKEPEVPPMMPEDIAVSRIDFSDEDKPFGKKIEQAIADAVGYGPKHNFPNQGSMLRALIKMAQSQREAHINVANILNPAKGLARNEAIVLAATLGLKFDDRSKFMQEAQAAFSEAGGDVDKGWRHVEHPVDVDLLIAVRPILVADAINEERAGVTINLTDDTPKRAPVAPVTEAKPKAARPRPEPKPKVVKPAPVIIPSRSIDELHTAQEEAIKAARTKFAALETYDDKAIANIATELFLELVENSTLSKGYMAKSLFEAADEKISIPTFQVLVSGRGKLNHESFAVGGAVDALVPKLLVKSEYVDEVKNYLTGMPLQKTENVAHDALHYVKDHGGDIGDFLRLMRWHHRKEIEAFATEVLHIKKDGFTRLSMGKCQRSIGETDIVTTACDSLKITDEEDRLIFRKMAILIPLDANQDALKNCFKPAPPEPPADPEAKVKPKKHYFVNAEAVEPLDRAVALSRFYELLRMVHGKRDFEELAAAIAEHGKLGDAVADEINRSMHNTGGRGGFDEEKEGKIKEKSNKTVRPNIAKAIANFAFPEKADKVDEENKELRKNCEAFLNKEKKSDRSQSAAETELWTTRHEAGTPGSDDSTPGGSP